MGVACTPDMCSKRTRDDVGEDPNPPSKRTKKLSFRDNGSDSPSSETQVYSDGKSLSLSGAGIRRYPWGNATCQDLITQALLSTSTGHLTLKELFLWFEQHHRYFTRRSHIAKTEGWKKYVHSTLVRNECFTQHRDGEKGKLVWKLVCPSEPWVLQNTVINHFLCRCIPHYFHCQRSLIARNGCYLKTNEC